MTAPSGASEPLSTQSPPVGASGSLKGRTTSWPGASWALAASWASVRPVTVKQSGWTSPPSTSRFATKRTPPAWCSSTAVKRPQGFMSAIRGVRALIRSKSSSSRGTPASRAIAKRCRTAFVEPPVAATAAIAFSRASLVMT